MSQKPADACYPGLVSASMAAALTLVLFPALTVYFANVYDFSVGIADLIVPALLLTATIFVLLLLPGVLMPRAWRPLLVSLLLMLSVAAWLQANLLVRNYGVLDGGSIPWGDHTLQGVLELAIWLALLVVAVLFARGIARNAVTFAVALLAIQVVNVVISQREAPTPPNHHFYTASEQGRFDFSAERNVIVLVLDAFQADVFQEIISNEPEYREKLEGFHYFRNALAGYAKTYPSIPLMFSGQWYENEQPIADFMRDAYMRDSLPLRLREQDWDVRLYPYVERVVWFDEAVADNFQRARSETERMQSFGEFIDTGLFRVMPHFLKRWWLNDYDWRARRWLSPFVPDEPTMERADGAAVARSEHPHEAMRWLEDMQAMSTAEGERPAMRFYHLFVPHAPFLLNEALEMENMPINREGFYRHSVAAVNLLLAFFEQLKTLGIYDDTFIAVLSEHGGGEYRTGVKTDLLPSTMGESVRSGIAQDHYESGLPLVLLKPFASDDADPDLGRGELQVSDLPVSVGDLADTLAAAVGLNVDQNGDQNVDYGGWDLFSAERETEDALQRERRYLFYRFDGWANEYLPDMVEYQVSGHSWLQQSWTATDRVFEGVDSGPAREAAFRPLSAGDTLRFREQDDGIAYIVRGWGGQEADGMWTHGARSTLKLPLAQPLESTLQISLRLRPFIDAERVPVQRVEVRVNGSTVDTWEVAASGWYSFSVNAAEFGGASELEIALYTPDATSPAELLVATDTRELGVFLSELALDSAPSYAIGETLAFADGGRSRHFVTTGWSDAEPGHRWTQGGEAAMRLLLDEPVTEDLRLRFHLRPYLAEDTLEQQQVRVSANDSEIGHWTVSEQDWYEAVIPVNLIDGDTLRLRFEISDPTAPRDVGGPPDDRQLGLMALEMIIDHAD